MCLAPIQTPTSPTNCRPLRENLSRSINYHPIHQSGVGVHSSSLSTRCLRLHAAELVSDARSCSSTDAKVTPLPTLDPNETPCNLLEVFTSLLKVFCSVKTSVWSSPTTFFELHRPPYKSFPSTRVVVPEFFKSSSKLVGGTEGR